MADQLAFLTIRQLSDLVRTREVSPVELAETFLHRLETLGPRYNAVVTLTRERAMRQAKQAEQEIASGNYKGRLHGIPYGAKDLLATSDGIPTTWGASPLRNQVFNYDATVIRKLEAAGAVLAAKLAMVELAGGMGYRNPNASFTGPGISPWGDADSWSGGSSSGSGASVAAGLVPFAIGSETWGSILSPANNCGIAGLRPSYGRVSRHGAMALSWSLDKLGPLCLNADDCGLVLEAIAGYDPEDLSTTKKTYQYNANSDPHPRFKIGVIRDIADGCQDERDGDPQRGAEHGSAEPSQCAHIRLTKEEPLDRVAGQPDRRSEDEEGNGVFGNLNQGFKPTPTRDRAGPDRSAPEYPLAAPR